MHDAGERRIRQRSGVTATAFAWKAAGQFLKVPDHVGLVRIAAGVGEIGKAIKAPGTKG